MTRQLGISISHTKISAVLVRRSNVIWHGASDLSADDSCAEALARLLSSMPVGRYRTARATVAFGIAYGQLKAIQGLPAGAASNLLSRIVRENTASFFLRSTQSLIVSEVERRPDGSAWAAAFDGPLVDSIVATLRRIGVSKVRVMSGVAAVASLLPPGTYVIQEGDVAVEISTTSAQSVASCRRIRPSDEQPPPIEIPPALDAIGPNASEFHAAFGAAMYAERNALTWSPPPDEKRSRTMRNVRRSGALALFAACLLAAVLAPAARAKQVSDRARRELTRTREAQRLAPRLERDMRDVTADLDRIGRFQSQRGHVTMLLGAISQALPESTALVSFRLDEKEGSFVTLTPHAAEVLPQLVGVAGIVAPRIVGSMTREIQGGSRVERASIRFRRPREVR